MNKPLYAALGIAVVIVGLGIYLNRETPLPTSVLSHDGTTSNLFSSNQGAWMNPSPTTGSSTNSNSSTQTSSTPTTVNVRGGELTTYVVIDKSGRNFDPETYEVVRGRHVVLRVTYDANDILVFENYGKRVELKKGVPTDIEFDATLAGSFPLKLEKAKLTLGYIQINAEDQE